jgi:hypothetical protein
MKQEGIHQDLQENHGAGDREMNNQILCQVAKDQELDVKEGSAPSKTKVEPTHSFGIK